MERMHHWSNHQMKTFWHVTRRATNAICDGALFWNIVFVLMQGPSSAFAEDPYQITWVRQLGTAGADYGEGVSADGLGNFYLSGSTSGNLAAPELPPPSPYFSPFLAKFDTNGSLQWVKQETPEPVISQINFHLNYRGSGVAADSLGNVFETWNTSGNEFRPSSLSKYNIAGARQWNTPLSPTPSFAIGVTTDDLGYAYQSSYKIADSSIYLRKFDANTGSIIWTRKLETGNSLPYTFAVSADHMGSVYVSGATQGSAIGPSNGDMDAIVAKYSDAGDLLWARQFGSAAYDFATGVAADRIANVFTTGRTVGDKIFVAKHDALGTMLWFRQLDALSLSAANGVWADQLGNAYLVGRTYDGQSADFLVAKYDATGTLLWTKQFGTAAWDDCSGITGDGLGSIFLACHTAGSLGAPNAGSDDAVLIKLSPVPEPATLAQFGIAVVLLAFRSRDRCKVRTV
jgi:outer membrane protein assembly factor BamB